MSYRTPLGRVKDLGASHSGSKEWLLQKVSSVILAVLFLWFAISFATLIKEDHRTVMFWVGNPINLVLLLTFVTVGIYHAAVGLQVIIEDYVPQTCKRVVYIYVVKTLLAMIWLLFITAILNTAFLAFFR